MIDPMLVVCHKLAAASSILNDGPDDSDADMAAGYIIEATKIAREAVKNSPLTDGQILDAIRMKPEKAFAQEAGNEEAPGVA